MTPLRTESFFARCEAGDYLRRFRDAEKFAGFCCACTRYGMCWACPPFGFDAEEYLSGRATVWIVGTKIVPEERFRRECESSGKAVETGRGTLDGRLLELEREYPGSRAFFAGTCILCPEGACTRRQGRPCLYPEKVRPSLEAFGLDMQRTADELLGVRMKWSRSGEMPEYFTLVSGFFTDSRIDAETWRQTIR